MKVEIVLFILLSLASQLFAQGQIMDTVEFARARTYDHDFQDADRLLTEYSTQKTNIHALRLHAQVLYWMQDFQRAAGVHQKAIAAYPDVAELKLDYGRLLFETNQHKLAEKLLKDYLQHDSQHVETHLMLAYMAQWNSHFEEALFHAREVLKQYPDQQEANKIIDSISQLTAPYLKGTFGYFSDDQPLNSGAYQLATGWFKSWLLFPTLQVQFNNFNIQESFYRLLWLQAGNTVYLARGKTALQLKGGFFQHYYQLSQVEPTFYIGLSQKISSSFFLDLSTDQKPYQHTLSSLISPLMQRYSALGLRYKKADRWMGKVAYEMQKFRDGNAVHTAYAWMLMPLVHQLKFKFHAGYSFNFSNAEESTYTIVEATETVRLGRFVQTQVQQPVLYDPYFTPANQRVHALLGSMKLKFSEKAVFSSNASVGVLARADAPYFAQGGTSGNQTILAFGEVAYLPVELQNELKLSLSSRLSLGGSYVFNSLFFYKSHVASFHFNYLFR